MPEHNPLIVALDTTDVLAARQLAKQLKPHVGAVKLGLEFFTANGAAGVAKVTAQGVPLFLDLKFHDIPNTVAGAVRATVGLGAFMMTVHTCGGPAMLKAAADASMEVAERTGKERPLIIGVTVLTSLDQDDLSMIGVNAPVHDHVRRLADLAQTCRLDGVVCSPYEIAPIRQHCGDELLLVVPGIRPHGSDAGDQKRIMTPADALAKGADFLVIGRPITETKDPAKAAQTILESLS